ncbi:hypothetical protein F3Y22_tig00000218pilonHSYRG00011 [Hibiscus syriacus]|uniref:Uncharacterized protein n=1 Tax=Hibiscus syriacus TaxID=106335 RepID=A0A6A3D7N8_HIBSY|nr:hypothetical protein F3Y22_tig00000218pilonHSYRG00011 [Hibiscus syriacus]
MVLDRDFGCDIAVLPPSELPAMAAIAPATAAITILTANPDNMQYVLKTHFNNYPKGYFFINVLFDFLGNGIFNVNRESWKFERQVSSHEFNTKSLCKFVETVVDTELHDRLIPMLSVAASEKTVLDLHDVL